MFFADFHLARRGFSLFSFVFRTLAHARPRPERGGGENGSGNITISAKKNRGLLALLTLLIATAAIPARAQQIPAAPPKQWSVDIRAFGTTNQPGRDDLQISIHTNGTLPASMEARRPVYDEQGKMSLESPVERRTLSDAAGAAIYSAARAVILSHRLGEAPPVPIEDGDSVEITISSFDRKLSAVFAHSSAGNSAEFTALIKVLRATLPKEFLPGTDDHTERPEETRRK